MSRSARKQAHGAGRRGDRQNREFYRPEKHRIRGRKGPSSPVGTDGTSSPSTRSPTSLSGARKRLDAADFPPDIGSRHESSRGHTLIDDLIILFDIDNTLLDNDRIQRDLGARSKLSVTAEPQA